MVAVSSRVSAQNEIKQAKNSVPIDLFGLMPAPTFASKMYFYEGDSILVKRRHRTFCPSGASSCVHGHGPASELVYTTKSGLSYMRLMDAWTDPTAPAAGWEALIKMIQDDKEFGPTAFGF